MSFSTAKTPWAIFLVMLLTTGLFAQNKYAGEFLSLGAGARASALGGAVIATVNDVTAGYYNPAGLMALGNGQIAYNHSKLFISDINYDFGAFAFPWGERQAVGISFVRLGVDNIAHTVAYRPLSNGEVEIIDSRDYDPSIHRTDVKNYFSYASYAVYFSYAKRFDERLNYGANIKLIHNGARYASANGLGLDFGVQYDVTSEFVAAAMMQDVTGTLVAWNTGKREWITPSIKIGGAYRWHVADDHQITPMLDIQNYFENRRYASHAHLGAWSADFHAGLEYAFKRRVFLRAGYNELNTWTMGTGVKLGLFQFDYAYTYGQSANALGDIHRIHVQFDLKSPRLARQHPSQ